MLSVFWPLGCFILHAGWELLIWNHSSVKSNFYKSNCFKNSSNKKIFNHLEPPCFAFPLRNLTQHLLAIDKISLWLKDSKMPLFFGAFWLRLSTVLLLQHHPCTLHIEPFSGASGQTPAVRDFPHKQTCQSTAQ